MESQRQQLNTTPLVFPSPLRGSVMESFDENMLDSAIELVSIPVEGKCYGKKHIPSIGMLCINVSIPVEGKCYGKSVPAVRVEGTTGFHPR